MIRKIHKWTGLVIGLFIFILCVSGAFIVIGRLTGSYGSFFGWMKKLHCTLFLGETGRMIVGLSTLLLVVEVITGYDLWLKFARKGFARSLRWTKPTKRLGLHVAGGFWCGLPLLLMALTGLTWAFGWFSDLVYALFDPAGTGNLFHSIIRLHTGGFWNTCSRIVWLAATILGASLPVTGLLITLKKRH